MSLKKKVKKFWNEASCGEKLYLKGESGSDYRFQLAVRYKLEPYIIEFAKFSEVNKKDILEVGVGLGADHQMFASAGANLYGIDLTERAIVNVKKRFDYLRLESNLSIADAESMPFSDNTFDGVYSWGVLHHTPDTIKAIAEVRRILRPGGFARVMIYHKYSFVNYMLWLRYALMRFQPWLSLSYIAYHYLESPGTKVYTIDEAHRLFRDFKQVSIKTQLSHADTLDSQAGQRHYGLLLDIASHIYPRKLIKSFFKGHGLYMMIEARK